jgi:hypothetical protein
LISEEILLQRIRGIVENQFTCFPPLTLQGIFPQLSLIYHSSDTKDPTIEWSCKSWTCHNPIVSPVDESLSSLRAFPDRPLPLINQTPRLDSILQTSLIKAARDSLLQGIQQHQLWPAIGSAILLIGSMKDATLSPQVIRRGVSVQPRWSDLGEVSNISSVQSGIDASLVKLFSNETTSGRVFLVLQGEPFVKRNMNTSFKSLTVDAELFSRISEALTPSERQWWEEQAFAFVRHAFPRGQALDEK